MLRDVTNAQRVALIAAILVGAALLLAFLSNAGVFSFWVQG